MIQPDRLLPQQQIYNFLRSVTIKYSPVADYLNETLIQQGYAVNATDPTTWKYYLNMTGQYHVSDTPMEVVSLDTRQTILFSPDVLVKHPRTVAAYSPGGAYYKRLCETYPQQVDLIKSILFPVTDMAKAIAAPNLTLLAYGNGYLEPYEQPVLIMAIEKFLTILVDRWYFDFLSDEPYFYLTFWGSLWTYLAMLLLSERMANIRTPYVHSWHIWNELEANGISNYSDILDRSQSMMIYEDINYLKANAGKQSNLILLANRLLTDFGVALYGRIVVQEAASAASSYQLTPQLVPVRIPTDNAALAAEISTEDVSAIQTQIFSKGLTASDDAETVAAVARKLGDTTLNYYPTKFLEIRPIPLNRPYADAMNMFLIETLVLLASTGVYANSVEVIDPLTTNALYLTPANLIALYHYATYKSLGITPVTFPTQMNYNLSFLPTIKTPAKTFPWQGDTVYVAQFADAEAYLADLSYPTIVGSPADFTTAVSALLLRFLDHRLADENTSMETKRAVYRYLENCCHSRRIETIELVSGFTTYEDWFGPNGIDIDTLILSTYKTAGDAEEAWSSLADAILSALIPINSVLQGLGNFTLSEQGYNRLRQLFVQMCSYKVVFLESDRNTADFALNYKWSNKYSPNVAQSYMEWIGTTIEKDTNTAVMTREQTLNPGVTEYDVATSVQVTKSAQHFIDKVTSVASVKVGEGLQAPMMIKTSSQVVQSNPFPIGQGRPRLMDIAIVKP